MSAATAHRRLVQASLLAPIALCACLLAAGCGGSSGGGAATNASAKAATAPSAAAHTPTTTTSSTTSSAAGAKTTTAAGARPPASSAPAAAGGLTALRGCLARHGVHLPAGKNAQGAGVAGGPYGAGALALPRGVSGPRYRAALRACGMPGVAHPLGRAPLTRSKLLANPTFKRALDGFVACMNEHGVKLPAPNTSGAAPIFPAGALDTKSPSFRAAIKSCGSKLAAAFRLATPAPAPAKPSR